MEQQPWQYRAAEWIENHSLDVALGVNPLLISLVALFCSHEIAEFIAEGASVRVVFIVALLALLTLVALHGYLIVRNYKRNERMSDLRKANADLASRLAAIGEIRPAQIKPLIFAYLKQLGEHDLEFGSRRGDAERLTLYLHDDKRPVFTVAARFSNSPEFSEVPRPEYPDNQGCMASAWVKGWHCAFDYPDPQGQPSSYLERSLKDKMPKDTINRLRMKSRLYCGGVIWNKQRTKQVGLLMLEATYDRYQRTFMEEFMKKHEQGYLSELINAMRTV